MGEKGGKNEALGRGGGHCGGGTERGGGVGVGVGVGDGGGVRQHCNDGEQLDTLAC